MDVHEQIHVIVVISVINALDILEYFLLTLSNTDSGKKSCPPLNIVNKKPKNVLLNFRDF